MRLIVYSLLFINLAIPFYFVALPYLQEISSGEHAVSLTLPSSKKESTLEYSVTDENNACYLLGPFSLASAASSADQRALELGIDGEVVEVRTLDYTLYRVTVPPNPSQGDAASNLQVLQANAIDSYMVQNERQEYLLSLGLFRGQESAQLIQEKATQLGIGAEITEDPRYLYEYWYQVREIYKLSEKMRTKIQGEGEKNSWALTDCRSSS